MGLMTRALESRDEKPASQTQNVPSRPADPAGDTEKKKR